MTFGPDGYAYRFTAKVRSSCQAQQMEGVGVGACGGVLKFAQQLDRHPMHDEQQRVHRNYCSVKPLMADWVGYLCARRTKLHHTQQRATR